MPSRRKWIGLQERIRRFFGGNPPRIQVAALPWRERDDGKVEVLLITSRGTGRWVLPKGWIDGREDVVAAAAREAFEEAGVRGKIGSGELGRYFYQKKSSTGLPLRCEVAVIPLEVTDESSKWPERKERTKRWLSPEEAASLVQEPDLSELIASFNNPRESAA